MRKLLILFLLATTSAFGQPSPDSVMLSGSTPFTPTSYRFNGNNASNMQFQFFNTSVSKWINGVTGYQFQNFIGTATQNALSLKANDASVVHNTGNETIAGIKNFTSIPTSPTPSTTDRSTKVATMAAVYALSKSIADSSANYNTTQLFTATKTSTDSVVVAPNATILTVTRSGAAYYYANNTSPTGNAFYYNGGTGSIKFQDAFNSTGENVSVTYRGSRTISGTVYYGPSSGIPTTVGDLSALTSGLLATTFISNTGTTYRYFSLVMNQAYTISQILDLDAGAFNNITSNYIFRGTIVISGITYNVFTMINGIPYSTNHRHQITIN